MQLVGIIVPSRFAIEIDYQLTVIVQIHSGVENPAADAMPCPSDQSASLGFSRPRRAGQSSSGRAARRPISLMTA